MRVVRRPRFIDDLAAEHAYLGQRSPRAASAFLNEVDRLIQLLATFPKIGRVRDELQGLRSAPLRGFQHILFYTLKEDRLVMQRALHGGRNLQELLRDFRDADEEDND